jgi:hypothetical protein
VLVDLDVFAAYYSYENLSVPINITVQSCSNGIVSLDTTSKYGVELSVVDITTGASAFQ